MYRNHDTSFYCVSSIKRLLTDSWTKLIQKNVNTVSNITWQPPTFTTEALKCFSSNDKLQKNTFLHHPASYNYKLTPAGLRSVLSGFRVSFVLTGKQDQSCSLYLLIWSAVTTAADLWSDAENRNIICTHAGVFSAGCRITNRPAVRFLKYPACRGFTYETETHLYTPSTHTYSSGLSDIQQTAPCVLTASGK